MKKIVILFLLVSNFINSQELYLDTGYNSGFVASAGIGLSNVDWDAPFGEELNNLGVNIGYKVGLFDWKFYHGPRVSSFVTILNGLRFGISGNYLFYDNESKFYLEPEIGISFFQVLRLQYTYNVSKIDDFFPSNYNRWGVTLGINISIARFN